MKKSFLWICLVLSLCVFTDGKDQVREPAPRSVHKVVLSKRKIIRGCASSRLENNSCSNNSQTVEVSAKVKDAEIDVLVYIYKVSGGVIVGRGAKVIWDLSGVKPGTYTITADLDTGRGGTKPLTKQVKVVECPDCKTENE